MRLQHYDLTIESNDSAYLEPDENGPWCLVEDAEDAIAEARAMLDVDRLAKALWKTRPQMYPDAWPNDDPDDIGPHPEEDARNIAAAYAELAPKQG